MIALAMTLFMLATPDAGASSADDVAILQADLIRSDPTARRVVLSALRCDAEDRAATSEATMERPRGFSLQVLHAWQAARADVDRVDLQLAVLEQSPLACSAWAVAELAECLQAVAPTWCTTDPDLRNQVLAAEQLSRQEQ